LQVSFSNSSVYSQQEISKSRKLIGKIRKSVEYIFFYISKFSQISDKFFQIFIFSSLKQFLQSSNFKNFDQFHPIMEKFLFDVCSSVQFDQETSDLLFEVQASFIIALKLFNLISIQSLSFLFHLFQKFKYPLPQFYLSSIEVQNFLISSKMIDSIYSFIFENVSQKSLLAFQILPFLEFDEFPMFLLNYLSDKDFGCFVVDMLNSFLCKSVQFQNKIFIFSLLYSFVDFIQLHNDNNFIFSVSKLIANLLSFDKNALEISFFLMQFNIALPEICPILCFVLNENSDLTKTIFQISLVKMAELFVNFDLTLIDEICSIFSYSFQINSDVSKISFLELVNLPEMNDKQSLICSFCYILSNIIPKSSMNIESLIQHFFPLFLFLSNLFKQLIIIKHMLLSYLQAQHHPSFLKSIFKFSFSFSVI
jgi:hypothetical protein